MVGKARKESCAALAMGPWRLTARAMRSKLKVAEAVEAEND
jgi:hypothetical protein